MKKGYFALQQAFAPIHVMMDWPDLAGELAGSTFRHAIYVVNDCATEYPSLTVAWQVLDAVAQVLAQGSIPCAVAANSLSQVGEVSWTIPLLTRYACHPLDASRTFPQQRSVRGLDA